MIVDEFDDKDLVMSYPRAVHYLRRTYDTNEVISQGYHQVISLKQADTMMESNFAELICAKAHCCVLVLSERLLKSILEDRLSSAIQTTPRNRSSTSRKITLTNLKLYTHALVDSY